MTAAASLVGMYDAESDSLTWTGGETARQAWKELAHAIVPWEEWDERPGYMLATGALNIGSLAVGAALTVTGVGAVAGVPLLAWRGMDILDAMGGSGRRGGADVDLPDLAELPHTGGNGPPVVHIDTTGMSPSQLAELKVVLEDLALAQSGGDGPSGGGSGQSNGSEHGPTGGDLNRAEEALSPGASGRGDDSGPGAKNSGDNQPSDWRGEVGGARPNNRGSEPEPALVGGGGNNNTFTESRGNPTSPPPRANATEIDAPGSGSRSGNEPAESRSENRQDRQSRPGDDQSVPARTGDTRADGRASTTSNDTHNETTGTRGNTPEESTSNSNQQDPGGGSNNGGGSSGNGGGDGGSPGDPSTGGADDGEPYRSPQPGTPEYENRLRELKDDPASGPANTQHKEEAAHREAEVGLAAERQGLLRGPIRRGEMDYTDPSKPKDGGDFIDATGQPWDVKGFRDTFPPSAGPMAGKPLMGRGAFNISKVEKAIRKELEDGENVLLDLGVLTDANNRKSIEDLVGANSEWSERVVIVYV